MEQASGKRSNPVQTTAKERKGFFMAQRKESTGEGFALERGLPGGNASVFGGAALPRQPGRGAFGAHAGPAKSARVPIYPCTNLVFRLKFASLGWLTLGLRLSPHQRECRIAFAVELAFVAAQQKLKHQIRRGVL